jgi:ABC-type sulfate transport system permease component
MCQIAGGSVGLGINTAIVATSSSLVTGIRDAFLLDAALATGGLVVALLFVGGPLVVHTHEVRRHLHRAHL